MATQCFFRSETTTTHRGTNTANLRGTNKRWAPKLLTTTRGSAATDYSSSSVTGATPGVEVEFDGNTAYEWLSDPVDADVTISGTITANIWGREFDMSANVAINVVIDIVRANTFGADGSNEIVNIVTSTRTTELAVSATTNAVNNFTTGMTSGAYTAETVNKGDRLRVRIFGDDAGTMGAGFIFVAGVSGSTAAANGDSYVTFTETFSFMSLADPSGSKLRLSDTASDVATASVDREAWTTITTTNSTDVTNTVNGPTNPIQVTDTAGGTVVDWFTKQLSAFTLTGLARGRLLLLESSALANASARLEVARVDSDGTNATVWASWCLDNTLTTAGLGELDTSAHAETFWITGDDLAFTDGQRIRIRAYVDDMSSLALVTSVPDYTVTLNYGQDDGDATRNSWLWLTQSVTEFSGGGGTTYTKAGYGRESA